MSPIKGKSEIVFPTQNSGADEMAQGAVTIVTDLVGRELARGRDELTRQFEEVQVDSVRDICSKFRVTIDGAYDDADGNRIDASIPVEDESTFTPDGLTRADAGLFRMYVAARTFEQVARHLDDTHRDSLTVDEVAHLQATQRVLEASLQEEDQ